MKYIVSAFLAVGGVGMIVNWLINNELSAVDRILTKLLSNPQYRPLLMKWRPEIEKALKLLDEEVAKDLDAANQEDNQKNTQNNKA